MGVILIGNFNLFYSNRINNMTICKKCRGWVPDTGEHFCYPISDSTTPYKYIQIRKCDICGSTAIDHTENQCQINRSLKKNLKSS